jgi:hypothetical protein
MSENAAILELPGLTYAAFEQTGHDQVIKAA